MVVTVVVVGMGCVVEYVARGQEEKKGAFNLCTGDNKARRAKLRVTVGYVGLSYESAGSGAAGEEW